MRRLLVLVVLGLCLAASSAVSAGAPWNALPYYDTLGGRLWYATDESWTGADRVKVGRLELPKHIDPAFKDVKRQYVWGPTCGLGRERRTFSKTIMAPGDPLDGTFLVAYGPGTLDYRPYEAASFRVNGVEIAKLPRMDGVSVSKAGATYRTGSVPARARAAFRHGANTLTLSVTRAPLRRGLRCSDPRTGRYTAAFAEVLLDFGADLKVAAPMIPLEVQKGVTNGQAVGVSGTLRLSNGGPSTQLDGELIVEAPGPGTGTVTVVGSPKGLSDCTSGLNAPLQCKLVELKAGATIEVPFLAALKVDLGSFRAGAGRLTINVSFIGHGMREADPKNNVARKVVVLCAAGATDPACA